MIAAYTITISRTTAVSQCTSAYKIFFIILELVKQFISSPPFYPLIKQNNADTFFMVSAFCCLPFPYPRHF